MLAVDAAGWEKSPLGAAALSRAAEADPELEIRKHALAQLSMIPEFWRKAEPTFVKALADDNDDIRVLAAKACYFSHFFLSANPKLIELAEKDRSPLVRTYALNTLARLKVRQAQPALIRLLSAPDDDEKFRKHVLSTLGAIADFPFHDAKSALDWWTKTGREAYERTAGAEAKTDSAPSAPGADGFAPVVRLNGSGGGLETPASSVPSAEVLDLNGNTVTATPLKTAGDRPRSTVRKFDTDPDPESVGSRKRREQQEKAQQAK
jgi:HEAT repeat protein